jgi:hypothetical protein
MGKKCRNIRAKWSKENLEKALDTVKNGMSQTSVSSCSVFPVIQHMNFNPWINLSFVHLNATPDTAFAPSTTTDNLSANPPSSSTSMSVAAGPSGVMSVESPPDINTTATLGSLATGTPKTSSRELATSLLFDRSGSTSFLDIMPSPKISKKDPKKRRKSLNYVATVVSRQLFIDRGFQTHGSKHKLQELVKPVRKQRDEKTMKKTRQIESANKRKSKLKLKNVEDKAQDNIRLKHQKDSRKHQKEYRQDSKRTGKLNLHTLQRAKRAKNDGKSTNTEGIS